MINANAVALVVTVDTGQQAKTGVADFTGSALLQLSAAVAVIGVWIDTLSGVDRYQTIGALAARIDAAQLSRALIPTSTAVVVVADRIGTVAATIIQCPRAVAHTFIRCTYTKFAFVNQALSTTLAELIDPAIVWIGVGIDAFLVTCSAPVITSDKSILAATDTVRAYQIVSTGFIATPCAVSVGPAVCAVGKGIDTPAIAFGKSVAAASCASAPTAYFARGTLDTIRIRIGPAENQIRLRIDAFSTLDDLSGGTEHLARALTARLIVLAFDTTLTTVSVVACKERAVAAALVRSDRTGEFALVGKPCTYLSRLAGFAIIAGGVDTAELRIGPRINASRTRAIVAQDKTILASAGTLVADLTRIAGFV